MIVALLLVIIAIMLFGAAAVRGTIGMILLGIIVVVVGTLLLSWASYIPAWLWIVLAGVVLVGGAWAYVEDAAHRREYDEAMLRVREAEAAQAKTMKGFAELTRKQEEAHARLARHRVHRKPR